MSDFEQCPFCGGEVLQYADIDDDGKLVDLYDECFECEARRYPGNPLFIVGSE